MKILRLDLKAFGPFTNQRLAFQSKAPGLHIIFGPNEAGKSSALRGLKALLYGFPKQCSDNHLHANAQLLVGACLERDGGHTLDFMRRKKTLAALRDPEDHPLADNALNAFLPGIDVGIFESLYAIDHKVLVQGGEDLLAQKGEVGQALFSAAAGILSLQRILEGFDAEADQLFSARASTKPLNRALTAYKTLKKSVKSNTLSSRDWTLHREKLEETTAARSHLQKIRSEKLAQQQRLKRFKQAIPRINLRENIQKKLKTLGKVRILPEDFSERVQEARQGRLNTLRQMDRAGLRLTLLQEEKSRIHPNQALLKQAALIPGLYQGLGAYQKGKQDKPRLDAALHTCRNEAQKRLRRVHPELALENIEALRPVLRRKKRVQSLSHRYEALVLQVSGCKKNLQNSLREQEEIALDLCGLPQKKLTDPLEQSLKLAMKAGDLDEQIRVNRQLLDVEKKQCADTFKRMNLMQGPLSQLSALFLPLQETVDDFAQGFAALDAAQETITRTSDEAETRLRQVDQELNSMRYSAKVPTEADLAEGRKRRQEGWKLIRRAWLKEEKIEDEAMRYAPGCDLAEAFEKQVLATDQLADRLRREASRVARFADLKAQSESLKNTLATNAEKQAALVERLGILQLQWQALWKKTGIEALSPKEMSAWLDQCDKLRARVDEVEKKEKILQAQISHRTSLSQALHTDLKQLEGEMPELEMLAPLVLMGESTLDTLRIQHQKRESLEEKCAVLEKSCRACEAAEHKAKTALQDWQLQWREALAGLQLGDLLSPEEASDMLEDLQASFDKLKQAGDFASRIKGIDRDAQAYELEIKNLLEQIAPELLNQAVEHAVVQLHKLLEKAKQDLILQEKNRKDRTELETEIGLFASELRHLDLQIQQQIKEADCGSPEHLNAAMARSKDYIQSRDQLNQVETDLLELSEGESLEQMMTQAAEVQSENLTDEIAKLKRDIEEDLDPEIVRLSEAIGDEALTLRQMDGSADAAEAAASAEQVLAGIGRMASHYVRLKLASTLLHEEIDRYRSQHQDPVLKRASSYFSRLTMNAFAEIRSDINDKGLSVLIGLRSDGRRVPVESMSTGTRDQLYLALRLAIVESRLASSEAIPLIVDDILINFDDDRSRATLEALADLGQKNQVILFTHHRQIVNDAEKMKGPGETRVHELART